MGIPRKILKNKVLRFKILSGKELARKFLQKSKYKETGKGQMRSEVKTGRTQLKVLLEVH